jgi:hypothetical protein
MRGGRSNKPTVRTIDGIPVTEDAYVDIGGYGAIPVSKFQSYKDDMDREGTGGEPGYD